MTRAKHDQRPPDWLQSDSMLRILIVDDERWVRTELKMLLADCSDVSVVGEADSVATAIAQLEQCDPDLMFLDIQLRGESAFDIFDQTQVRGHVVFVTAHEEYARRAFDVDAVDYLVKPLRSEHVVRALSRARQRPQPAPTALQGRLTTSDRVFIRAEKELRACEVGSIAYVQAAEAFTEVHLSNAEVLIVRERLHAWEERLPPSFVRIHRSTLVNLALVERLTLVDGRWQVQLRGLDEVLAVSRRLAQSIRAQLETR